VCAFTVLSNLELACSTSAILTRFCLQILTEDYSKAAFLCSDRSVCLHARFGSYYKLRVPRFGRDIAYAPFTAELLVAGSAPEVCVGRGEVCVLVSVYVWVRVLVSVYIWVCVLLSVGVCGCGFGCGCKHGVRSSQQNCSLQAAHWRGVGGCGCVCECGCGCGVGVGVRTCECMCG